MQERHNNRPPMIVLIGAIAYFLAGSFTISTAMKTQSSGGISTIQITNWLTFVVSSILILAGFIYLISTLTFLRKLLTFIWERLLLRQPRFRNFLTTCKLLTSFGKRFLQLKPWFTVILIIFLFIVTLTQVLTIVIGYINIHPLLIVSATFLFMLLVSIVYTSRQIFRNLEQLLDMIFALSAIGIYMLFTEDFTSKQLKLFSVNLSIGQLELIIVLILISFLTIWAIAIFSKQRERQLPLFRRRDFRR